MKNTWFGTLGTMLCCCAAVADDAAVELAKHLGKTPALVNVCEKACPGDSDPESHRPSG